MDGPKYIDAQIALLQPGIVDFGFLNYLEANLRLSVQELVNVFKNVYSDQEEKEEANV